MRHFLAAVLLFGLSGLPAPAAADNSALDTTFTDTSGSVHESAIEFIASSNITLGCNPPANTEYCPSRVVTRGEMAIFLARALNLGSTPEDHFIDDDGSVWEGGIDRIAAAGITEGCNPPQNTRYCPDRTMTRGQIAAMLTRAFDIPTADNDFFSDDDGHIFEGAINQIAQAEITLGCNPPANTRFCPDEGVTRAQMATLLTRALRLADPDRLDGSADLLVFGDWGSGTTPQELVADQMADYSSNETVAAIVTTGDNFYLDDTELLMAPYDWASDLGIPFVISWGNHDIETPSRIAQVNAAFGDPDRWYSREWGALDIIMLDSNQVDSEEQRAFLLEEMESSDRPTIVVFHHPPFSCSRHGANAEVADEWVGLFDADVALVLNGHDHVYERFFDDGKTYVVTGGGGRGLYDLEPCPAGHPAMISGAKAHHFVALDQSNDVIAATVVDIDGVVIDTFEIDLP